MQVYILLDGTAIDRWVADTLLFMLTETDATVSAVVVNSETDDWRSRLSPSPLTVENIGFFVKQGSQLVFGRADYRKPVDIDDIGPLRETDRRLCAPIPASGLGNRLPDEIVDFLSSDSDVVVRFDFGIIKRNVLTAPEHGVLSFHHGDIRHYRGRPSGLQEFMDGVSEAGVTLQQLNEDIDAGRIVAFESVDISDVYTYQEVKQRMFETSTRMLITGIENLEDPDFIPRIPNQLGISERCRTNQKSLSICSAIGWGNCCVCLNHQRDH